MMIGTFAISWIDRFCEPACPPDPAYPNGIDIDCSHAAPSACVVELYYPARRCGIYTIKCETCGTTALVTTAGRPDDPRSIRLACILP